MIKQRGILAFIYLLFTVLVNIQTVAACAKPSAKAMHNCCCSANGGCVEDMTCCADVPEDDSVPNEHQAISTKQLTAFFAAPFSNFSIKTVVEVKKTAGVQISKPPPKQKLFIAFHQLVLYA